MLSIHQNVWKGDEDSPGFLFFAGAPVCSQHQQRAVLEMCLEMCIQPCQCCSSGLCPILSDMAMPCSCYLGSEISWLLGRSGLAGIPASAPSQESGTWHAAWGSHEGRESTGAVAQCPTVCCGILESPSCGLIQIWLPRNWKGFRACCISKLMSLRHPTLLEGGAGQSVLPHREHAGLDWRVHSGKQ